MDKQTEIKTLQSLKGNDTYFGSFFGNQDIDQMCENIKNDFVISLGCSFNAKVAALEKKIADMEAAHKAEIEDLKSSHKAEMKAFGRKLIIENEKYVDNIYETLENQFGTKFIITTKYQAKQPLSDDELAYMIAIMNNSNK